VTAVRSEAAPPLPRPLFFALLIGGLAVVLALALALRRTGGHLVYAIDDPYIHMAMAKNLALHGTWGVNPSEFSSSSSSLLWTGMLGASFLVFGVREVIPFAWNVLFAGALLLVTWRIIVSVAQSSDEVLPFAVLALVTFVTPVPSLVFAGQEHLLHAAITLWFVFSACRSLSKERGSAIGTLVLAAAVLPLVRYESLFTVAIVCGGFMLRRRWRDAAVLAGSAIVPVAAYGALSAALGWSWLPNPVLMKGARPDLSSLSGVASALGYNGYSLLQANPAIMFTVCVAVAAWCIRNAAGYRDTGQWMLGVFVVQALLHLQFAQPRAFWFFRYEAYVLALGVVSIGVAALQSVTDSRLRAGPGRRRVLAAGAVVILVLSPPAHRAARAFQLIPRASANIYEQQYQMGLFLRQHYAGRAVALHDIGAATFLGDIQCVDLVGLANREVFRLKSSGWFTDRDIHDITLQRDVRVAILYDLVFRGRIPPHWVKVGSWTIPDNVVVGSDTVTFYAVRPEEAPRLAQALQEFAGRLPPTVTWRAP